MSSKPKLIACAVCGQRWIDVEQLGVACPWCESSCAALRELSEEAIAALKAAGIKDFR